MDTFLSILVYTFLLGSFYLLISLGFSILCGVLGIFNLGYGVTFLVAVYSVWMFMEDFGLSLWAAIVGMFVIQALFTLCILYYPIIRRFMEQEDLLLTSLLVVAMVVEEFVNYQYPMTLGVNIPTNIWEGIQRLPGGTYISNQMIFSAFAALILTGVFVIFLLKSRQGLLMRGLSQDLETAQLMGTNIERIYPLALLLSVIPPSIGILIIAPVWSIEPAMGLPLLETSIMVAILGGLGNIRGSMYAAYIIGFVAASVSLLFNARLVGLITLILVVLVLLFRPEGISRSETLW